MKIVKNILKTLVIFLLGVISFLGMAICGYFFAGVIHTSYETLGFLSFVLLVIGIFLAFYLSIILHEGGHLLFGLLTGYGFSSFRIGSLMWIKQDGSIKFRRFTISGTGGQCLMTPPEKKNGKIPVVLYNLGGVIMNLIWSAILVLVYFRIPNVIILSDILIIGAILSLIIALTNGIPLAPGGMPNDGMNAYYLAGNKTSAISFLNQLHMNSELAKGKRVSDMPPEWFTVPADADMQNIHNASIAVFAISRTMESMDFATAEKEIKTLLDSDYKISSIHRNLLTCDLVCCRLVLDGAKAEISSLLTIEQQKFMQAMKNFPSVLRTEYTIALIRDKNAEKAKKIKQNFEKVAKTYPYPQDIETEENFMKYASECCVGDAGSMSRTDV